MKILAKTSRSICVELEGNDKPYYSDYFNIYLNEKLIRRENRNVFSLFSLEPDTEYKLEANDESLSFMTNSEAHFINVKAFNAYGDGVHDDTEAFVAAIACMPENSTLFIPKGEYLLKPIFLKSNITLYFQEGTTLKGVANRELYPVLPADLGGLNFGTWQGEEADCFASIITAVNCENIKIIGEGEIDCNALEGDWYLNHRVKRIAWRCRGMFFNRCKNVLLQGFSTHDSPSWNIHPYLCEDVKIYDLKIKNIPTMPTTDGIDPDSCNGVEIVGVDISVGDDCIAVKSGTIEFAKKYGVPCKNIKIRNCLMREGHGGVVFGSELSGGIENIEVCKCIFEGTDRGFRVKTRRGRGRIGKCGNVEFKDVIMKNVKVPFVINMYYNMGDETGHTEYVWTREKLPVDDRTPELGSFTFKDMTCSGVEFSAGAFYGLPESPIKSIKLQNITFSYNENAGEGYPDMQEKNLAVKKQGLDFQYVENVELNNVKITGQIGEEVILTEVPKFREK